MVCPKTKIRRDCTGQLYSRTESNDATINPCTDFIHIYTATQAPNITPPTVVASAVNKGAEIWKRWTFARAAFLKCHPL